MATTSKAAAPPCEIEPEHKGCEIEGCELSGEYRAPRSRANLREFRWFCLKHVREYNSAWDFYKDMSPEEIETHLRSDAIWNRPSWPLGRVGTSDRVRRVLDDAVQFAHGSAPKPASAPNLPQELTDALATLGLAWPVSLRTVKAKYKKLAKRHHPDANDGAREAEEMFKSINLAYMTLSGKFVDRLLPSV